MLFGHGIVNSPLAPPQRTSHSLAIS